MSQYSVAVAPPSPSLYNNGQTLPSPRLPTGPISPRPRAGSFGFMRRQRSNEPSSAAPGESGLFRKKSVSKEEAAKRHNATSPRLQQPTSPNFQQPMSPKLQQPTSPNLQQPTSPNLQQRPFRPQGTPRIPSQVLPSMDVLAFSPETYSPSQFTPSPKFSSQKGPVFPPRRHFPMNNSAHAVPLVAVPVPPMPKAQEVASNNDVSTESSPKLDSITNRSRYSYTSSQLGDFNARRRVRRRKEPSAFNILVVGTKGCGKTSFIEFLRTSLSQKSKQRDNVTPRQPLSSPDTQRGAFTAQYVETDVDGDRLGVTIYDSKGLERHVVDLQLREMTTFVESKFQDTFSEEQKVVRSTGVQDTHIHCVILLLDPSRLDSNINMAKARAQEPQDAVMNGKPVIIGSLDEHLDIDVFRTLQNKTTVIPIISKADTVTTTHMAYLKRSVADCIKSLSEFGVDPYVGLHLNDETVSDVESTGQTPVNDMIKEEAKPVGESGSTVTSGSAGAAPSTTQEHAAPTPKAPTIEAGNQSSSSLTNSPPPPLPMSIISPDRYDTGAVIRQFPWGSADPNNPDHCDYALLKDCLFWEWKEDLRRAGRERFYESWRTARLRRTNTMVPIFSHKTTGAGSRTVSSSSSQEVSGMSGQRIPSGSDRVASGSERHPSGAGSIAASTTSAPTSTTSPVNTTGLGISSGDTPVVA